MSRTVYMHIGLAKSGTTYLQHILQANRGLLEENGVLFPGPKMSEHFMAALDVSGAALGGHRPPDTDGAWKRTADAANLFPGSTLISHEMFAPMSQKTIGEALESFGTSDVRVIVTARDFGRQVPAVWQERIKNGGQERYRDFLESLFGSEKGRRHQGGFWRMQYLVDISSRWAEVVGRERLTIVTVPQSAAAPRELWNRFAVATDLPRLDYSFDVGGRNRSLGVVESELLRRLNGGLSELSWPQYVRRVKRRFAEDTLAVSSTSERLAVPGDYQERVKLVSDQTIEHLEQLGCRVVGDFEDLRPLFKDPDPTTPDEVPESVVLELALGQLRGYVSRPPAPRTAADPGMGGTSSSAGGAGRARGLRASLKARLRSS